MVDPKKGNLDSVVSNWRGGLAGIAIFLLVWAAFFFIAFMTAFGNESPEARIILQVFSVFALVANPVWGIPLAYIAGAMVLRRQPDT